MSTTQHLCNDTGQWVEGTLLACGCRPQYGRPQLNRTGYQKKTRVWSPGPQAKQREHFDGRLDAKVNPKPVSVKITTTEGGG